ncbi:MAG TPA: NUDIX hydrolase [Roseiflexaceae bacterium]|nr:NUDIX hydrolase [Roseiflexaceae bacterium]
MAPRSAHHAAGCVVLRNQGGQRMILLIHDPYGRWTIPKGHLEHGEDAATAAVREVYEETGVRGELGAFLETIRYQVKQPAGTYEKRVDFFLMHTDPAGAIAQTAEGIQAAQWFTATEALERIGYPQVRDLVARALTQLE